MKTKGQITSLEVTMFVVIGVISVMMLGYFALNPYQAGSKMLKQEAARLNALNIAGALSLLSGNPDALYKYRVELKECTIFILPDSVVVRTQNQTGVAFLIQTENTIVAGRVLKCFTNQTTVLQFMKKDNVILSGYEGEDIVKAYETGQMSGENLKTG